MSIFKLEFLTDSIKIQHKHIMERFTKFMMSMLFILMLGCSFQSGYATKSSHFTSKSTRIDKYSTIKARLLTKTLTASDSLGQVSSQADSLLFVHVFDYVSQVSKRSCTERKEIAKTIVDIALENDIDICFILAQGTIETHLGTTGMGRTRKSIFGVRKTYRSYEHCIDSYAKLLKKSYLIKGRTEYDLMKRYVNISGSRYAGDLKYERRLKEKYYEILNTTKIYDLQEAVS